VAGLGLQALVDRTRSRPRLLRGLRVALAGVAALVTLDLYTEGAGWLKLGRGLGFSARSHRPVVRFEDRAEGERARLVDYAPHHFVIDVRSQQGSLLIFPLEPGEALDQWRADVGRLEQADGRLALRVPPGTWRIGLSYRPRHFRTALAISFATALGAAAALARGNARERLSQWLRGSARQDPASPG
jgi:hypothetical protein